VDCGVPTGPGIRLDAGIYAGWTVPNEYDPMLGKLIAWGGDRKEALARMGRALQEYYASGIKTNVSLFRRILASGDFQKGAIYTRWLDDFLSAGPALEGLEDEEESQAEQAAAIAAFLWHTRHAGGANASEASTIPESRWKTESRREQVNREPQP
jgi:acetyl-CoA carboxylase biotin carboxylase subunit